ncbi:transglutaminase-like domain-containing protein [Sandaracinobacteroides saxicola]|uniref:Transglutaminase family protein n=1 Tax=Sandaracinobacteroides saxicola TaxID=2759707 RepID=A0A7G5IHA3_9SPHN|nr:transglutaminase family protein [Sandaracinobacteroides saxicola]QMW22745.1 transglutaminase family protein [Sandaracinobacteroides saxicola]
MRIRAGYQLTFDCPAPTPALLMLSVHPTRRGDLLTLDRMLNDRGLMPHCYHDMFGNMVHRLLLPEGRTALSTDFVIEDSGLPDPVMPELAEHRIERLPDEVIQFLLPSRYCDVEALSDTAWQMFGTVRPGWGRVQAVCDYVHERIAFGYAHARATRTASEAHAERKGVCRDYAHLAVTLCRALNIPARYVTGYLGDIAVPPVPFPMDFSAWFQVFLGGQWRTFDARHNVPRVGRILMATGRDAADVALSTTFGAATLAGFAVHTDEVVEERVALAA